MSSLIRPALLGLGLIAGITVGAQAQTAMSGPNPATSPSIASLPPVDEPRDSSHNSIPGDNQHAVAPSPTYIGPAPGAGNGHMPPHFNKSADWDRDPVMHPYSSGMGPKPN
jgi:hypothetical protein